MNRVGIRELRNRVSEVVRRAGGGERIVITSNGIPVAELGPLVERNLDSIEALADAGLVHLPRSTERHPPPAPAPARPGMSSAAVLEELRSR